MGRGREEEGGARGEQAGEILGDDGNEGGVEGDISIWPVNTPLWGCTKLHVHPNHRLPQSLPLFPPRIRLLPYCR